ESYWVTGAAQVSMRDNIAISSAGGGINLFSTAFGIENARPVSTIPTRLLAPELRAIAPPGSRVPLENVPAAFFKGFEAYNAVNGMLLWQHLGNNDGQLTFNAPGLDPAHSLRTTVEDFKLWGIQDRGVEFQYSTQIDLRNGLIAGDVDQKGNFGIRTNGPSQNLGFENLTVESFQSGLTVPRAGRLAANSPYKPSTLTNSTFRNNDLNLSARLSYQTEDGQELFPDYFNIENTRFSSDQPNQRPSSQFNYAPIGGLSVQFDASNSSDPDVPGSRRDSNREIVAYGWDFDSNGTIDNYGRIVQRRFTSRGRKTVRLTVWDSHGRTSRSSQTFDVQPRPYNNPLLDGSFSQGTQLVPDAKFQASTGAGFGWLTSGWRVNGNEGQGGALEILNDRKGVAQVIYDDRTRIGQQVFSLDVKRVERDSRPGKAIIKVWGVNGEFDGSGWRTSENGPSRVGRLPFQKELLLGEEVAGSNRSFRRYHWDVDFGQRGYHFLVVQVNADNVNRNAGDLLLIDNVAINSPGGATRSRRARVDVNYPGSTYDRQQAGAGYGTRLASIEQGLSFPLTLSAAIDSNSDDDGENYGGLESLPEEPQSVVRGYGDTDRLNGENGNDIIVGGRSADVIAGGLGSDRFRWFQVEHGGDQIADFNPEEDLLEIRGENFSRDLQPGPLPAEQFVLGARAENESDRLIYNPSTGQVFFDRDGSGSDGAVVLATLDGKPMLTAENIRIL
ncbi:MAG: PKD domain-containing protein, partial [Cyanobacteria bacterium P01_F01_bin.42]